MPPGPSRHSRNGSSHLRMSSWDAIVHSPVQMSRKIDAQGASLRVVPTKIDKDFSGRLEKAVSRVSVPFQPTALGVFLGENKQSASLWINGSTPRCEKLFEIADKLGVDPRWLATGQGAMLPVVNEGDYTPEERELVTRYRGAGPKWQAALRSIATIATTEIPPQSVRQRTIYQPSVTGDVGGRNSNQFRSAKRKPHVQKS